MSTIDESQQLTAVPMQLTHREPTIMEIVSQLAQHPDLGKHVDAMERLLAMKERSEDREAMRLYADALAEFQANMPVVEKHGEIKVKGVLRSKYALIEDIDDIIRPLMREYGFAFMLSEIGVKDGMREFSGTLSHRGGHKESLIVHMPLDKSEFRSAVQSEGSTISYARRQLYKAFFNIVERGVDDDGSGQGIEIISEDQARDLQARLDEVKGNVAGFLQYFDIDKLSDLRKADLSRAFEMIEKKAKK
jgi:hypothetical protein